MHTVRVKLVNNINLALYKDTEPSSVQSVERSRGITLVDLRSIRVIIIIIILIMIYYL